MYEFLNSGFGIGLARTMGFLGIVVSSFSHRPVSAVCQNVSICIVLTGSWDLVSRL